jgi:hypothetical protein
LKKELRDLLVASDARRDPQALVLSPHTAFEISRVVVSEDETYHRILAAGSKALELIKRAGLELPPAEQKYIERLSSLLGKFPDDQSRILSKVLSLYGQRLPEHERELFRHFS